MFDCFFIFFAFEILGFLGMYKIDFSLENDVNLELKNLDKKALIKQTHETVKQEKMHTVILLQHLAEIEKRGLHLELGFSNLHSFLVVEFKYSDSEAAIRVQAMRLLKVHPIVKEKISEGTISLSQAADINRFIKAEAKSVSNSSAKSVSNSSATFAQTEGRTISVTEIIKEVEGKSIRESKELLEKMRSVPKAKTYSIEIDEEAWRIFQEIKKKESPSSRDGEFTKKILKERLERLNKLISKKENEKKNESENNKEVEESNDSKPLVGIDDKGKDKTNEIPRSRYIGKIKRLKLFQDANYQCEYLSPLTGRRCDCKFNLEVDHLYPYAWGGSHDIKNTRIFCKAHNLFYFENTFGKDKMASFRYQ